MNDTAQAATYGASMKLDEVDSFLGAVIQRAELLLGPVLADPSPSCVPWESSAQCTLERRIEDMHSRVRELDSILDRVRL